MWSERCADILKEIGFFSSRTEDDIWIRDTGTYYEYIARYIDDLTIVPKKPQTIIDDLEGKHKLKLKGTGPIGYHLGCDLFSDSQGVLCMSSKRYIEKMVASYQTIFGYKPKQKYSSPLEHNDHPELDMSEVLDAEGSRSINASLGQFNGRSPLTVWM